MLRDQNSEKHVVGALVLLLLVSTSLPSASCEMLERGEKDIDMRNFENMHTHLTT